MSIRRSHIHSCKYTHSFRFRLNFKLRAWFRCDDAADLYSQSFSHFKCINITFINYTKYFDYNLMRETRTLTARSGGSLVDTLTHSATAHTDVIKWRRSLMNEFHFNLRLNKMKKKNRNSVVLSTNW